MQALPLPRSAATDVLACPPASVVTRGFWLVPLSTVLRHPFSGLLRGRLRVNSTKMLFVCHPVTESLGFVCVGLFKSFGSVCYFCLTS
jgi:hypothetical protein